MEVSFYNFYHPLEQYLPRLIDKIYNLGQGIIIFNKKQEVIDILNDVLWTFSNRIFLPHGSNKELFPEKQPIYLTTNIENPNNAEIFIAVNDLDITNYDLKDFKKLLYVFNDVDLDKANKLSKKYQDLAIIVSFFKQEKDGNWLKL